MRALQHSAADRFRQERHKFFAVAVITERDAVELSSQHWTMRLVSLANAPDAESQPHSEKWIFMFQVKRIVVGVEMPAERPWDASKLKRAKSTGRTARVSGCLRCQNSRHTGVDSSGTIHWLVWFT